MAETAFPVRAPEPVTPTPGEVAPSPQTEVNINRFSVRRLRTYEGSENKSDIFNNGDVYGLKYAVPFNLRSGSQSSEQGGSQLAFSADPKDPKRFIISDDVRTAPSNAVVLEQRGDQLFVRVGDKPQQVYEKGGVRQSLTGSDFQRNSLVVPVNSEFSLAVTGFNPDTHQIVAQKVLPQSHFGEPLKSTGLVYSIDPVKRPVSEVVTNKTGRPYNYFDRNFPSVLGPSRKTEIPTTFRSLDANPTPTRLTEGYTPSDTRIPITDSNVLITTPPKQEAGTQSSTAEVLQESEVSKEKGEFLRRINILKKTTWGRDLGRIIGGLALISLLGGVFDRATAVPTVPEQRVTPVGFGPTQEPIPTEAVIRPPVIPVTVESKRPPQEAQPPTVLETNLKDQSTWGVFLHHLGKLDASAMEGVFPNGVPDNVRAGWDAVRELEAQTGQSVQPDDPLLLDAVNSAAQFLGKSNVEKLYGSYLQDIQRNNPGFNLAESTFKTDSRFNTSFTDSRITANTMKMRPLEDVLKATFVPKQGSVQA